MEFDIRVLAVSEKKNLAEGNRNYFLSILSLSKPAWFTRTADPIFGQAKLQVRTRPNGHEFVGVRPPWSNWQDVPIVMKE